MIKNIITVGAFTDKAGACLNIPNSLENLSMPKLPDSFSKTIAYLYPSTEHAQEHSPYGGTAFIIGKPYFYTLENGGEVHTAHILFLVSNRHVVKKQGHATARVNRLGGGIEPIPYEHTDWVVHPEGDDLAIIPLKKTSIDCDTSYIQQEDFITKEKVVEYELGLGEEIFMIGRFMAYQGREKNEPAARFGTISMMPVPIWNEDIGKDQESFVVEMKSKEGFSGSPVMVYRTLATNLAYLKEETPKTFYGLLGVNWGFLCNEDWQNTFFNGVVPAWKILDLLEVPKVKTCFEESVESWLEEFRKTRDGFSNVKRV